MASAISSSMMRDGKRETWHRNCQTMPLAATGHRPVPISWGMKPRLDPYLGRSPSSAATSTIF